jgi:hypothetical protein
MLGFLIFLNSRAGKDTQRATITEDYVPRKKASLAWRYVTNYYRKISRETFSLHPRQPS